MKSKASFATLDDCPCPVCGATQAKMIALQYLVRLLALSHTTGSEGILFPPGPRDKHSSIFLSDRRTGIAGTALHSGHRWSDSDVQLARTIGGEPRRGSQTEGPTQRPILKFAEECSVSSSDRSVRDTDFRKRVNTVSVGPYARCGLDFLS